MIGLAVANVNFPNAADSITLTSGVTFGVGGDAIRVSGDSGGVGFETVALRNNAQVNINTVAGGSDGADLVTITSANNVHGNANLTIDTGSGGDSIEIEGPLFVTNTLSLTSQQINFNTATAQLTASVVNLDAGAGAVSGGNPSLDVSGSILNAVAAGTISLDTSVNTLGSITSSSGDVLLREANGALVFNIEATLGNVSVGTTSGSLAIDEVVAGQTATLLATAGAITDSGTLNVIATSFVASAAAGIDLDTAVSSLSAENTTSGSILIDNSVGGLLTLTNLAPVAKSLANQLRIDAPLIDAVNLLIEGNTSITDIVAGLMSRPLKREEH